MSPTTARVRFLNLGGLSGALLGGGLYLAVASHDAKVSPFSVMTALGTTVGLSVDSDRGTILRLELSSQLQCVARVAGVADC